MGSNLSTGIFKNKLIISKLIRTSVSLGEMFFRFLMKLDVFFTFVSLVQENSSWRLELFKFWYILVCGYQKTRFWLHWCINFLFLIFFNLKFYKYFWTSLNIMFQTIMLVSSILFCETWISQLISEEKYVLPIKTLIAQRAV